MNLWTKNRRGGDQPGGGGWRGRRVSAHSSKLGFRTWETTASLRPDSEPTNTGRADRVRPSPGVEASIESHARHRTPRCGGIADLIVFSRRSRGLVGDGSGERLVVINLRLGNLYTVRARVSTPFRKKKPNRPDRKERCAGRARVLAPPSSRNIRCLRGIEIRSGRRDVGRPGRPLPSGPPRAWINRDIPLRWPTSPRMLR